MVEGASSYGTAEFMLGKAKGGENITLYDGGYVKRTLTYMGDLCRVLIRAAFHDNCINDVFNIGGECYSLKEMSELIAKTYGVKTVDIDAPENAKLIESGDTVFNSEKLDAVIGKTCYQMTFQSWIETCK
jgi:UDP-glucose 4-epimerase